jgi:prepilin peptidase CpaA
MDAFREAPAVLEIQVPFFPAAVVLVASLVAAVMDVWKFKVYNALTLPLLLTGLAYHSMAGGMSGFLGSLLGVLFGFSALVFVYALGGIGAGDVKLMAAVGAWLGIPLTFYVFALSALASGAYAVVLVLASGSLRETWIDIQVVAFRILAFGQYLGSDRRLEAEVVRPDRHQRLVPFGAMVAVGLSATMLLLVYL